MKKLLRALTGVVVVALVSDPGAFAQCARGAVTVQGQVRNSLPKRAQTFE
jgi:hypothetical protein